MKKTLVPLSKHEKYLRDLRCCVSKSIWITLHHCHGGSVKKHGWHVGMGQKQNPFLQIPLSWMYHTGDSGIDRIGVDTWERQFGTQMEKLRWVNDQLPYDLFEQAKGWEFEHRGNTATSRFTGRG